MARTVSKHWAGVEHPFEDKEVDAPLRQPLHETVVDPLVFRAVAAVVVHANHLGAVPLVVRQRAEHPQERVGEEGIERFAVR